MAEFDLGKVVGEDGKGISSIEKTGTSGLVDTYTITYTDNSTSTFTVTNGSDSTVDIVISWQSTTSDTKVPSEKLTKTSLDNKLDKTHTSYKGKNVVVDSSTGDITFENKYSHPSAKQCNASIPSSSSDLSDGASLVKTSNTVGLLKNDGSVMSSGTGSSNWAVGNHTHSAYVNPDIVDNLTTNDATKVLSAKQGKVLNDLIGDAITYINQ